MRPLLLIGLTALILALSGAGNSDRLALRGMAADAVAGVSGAVRASMNALRVWRSDHAAGKAAADAGAATPVSGSGHILSGRYAPEGADAAAHLGAADFNAAQIVFSRGLSLNTRPHRIALAGEAWSDSGRDFADLSGAPAPAQVEVRRVTQADLTPGHDVGCGPDLAPGWIAIVQRPADLDLILFHGDAAPGAGMGDAALCGAWRYRAQG